MLRLHDKLWNDEVGTTTAEFGLVTAVTVCALIMGMGDFAAKVNRNFEVAVQNPGLMSIEEQREAKEAKEKREEALELR